MPGKASSERQRLFELLIHDLTGPLSVVAASTTSLLQQAEGSRSLTSRQHATLRRIARNARRSQTILRDMVEILRSEARLFDRGSFRIDRVLEESILEVLDVDAPQAAVELAPGHGPEEFFARLGAHGIFVQISGRYRSATFPHDHRKVHQIVRNLLSNAVKYRRHRVDVKVSGDRDLLVAVADDGPGIAEEDQEAIFQRFVRLTSGDDRSVPGLGLGLAGVEALVASMGGKLSLVSREGAGTEFSVSIPPLE